MSNRIDMRRLRIALAGNDKLPKHFTCEQYVSVFNRFGQMIGYLWVKVIEQEAKCKHRVYVRCTECHKFQPAGRFAQHYKVHER